MTLPTTAESLAFADAQPGCTDVQKHLQSLAASFRDMEKARDHWKANCQNRVEAARLLIQRPDLPIERVNAYQTLTTLQEGMTTARTDILALHQPWPADEMGPSDEPASQYRLGYNTALEDALEALLPGETTPCPSPE